MTRLLSFFKDMSFGVGCALTVVVSFISGSNIWAISARAGFCLGAAVFWLMSFAVFIQQEQEKVQQ